MAVPNHTTLEINRLKQSELSHSLMSLLYTEMMNDMDYTYSR